MAVRKKNCASGRGMFKGGPGGDKLKAETYKTDTTQSLSQHDVVDASTVLNPERFAPKASLGEIIR